MNITEDFFNLLPLNLMKLLSIIYLTASIKFLTGEYYKRFLQLLPLNLMKLLSIIYLTASIKFLTGEYYRRFLQPFTIEFNETIVNYIFNSLNKVSWQVNITEDFFDLLPLNLMKLLSIIYLTASIKFLTGEYYRRFLRTFYHWI